MVREARFSCDADAGFQPPDLRDHVDDFDDPLFDLFDDPFAPLAPPGRRVASEKRRRSKRRRAKSQRNRGQIG